MRNKMILLLFAGLPLCATTAFKTRNAARKPDLQVQYPDPKFIKEDGSIAVYEFTIKNIGTKTAELGDMTIRTAASANWTDPAASYPEREVASEPYMNMHYDRPPNPAQLDPGQSVVVRAMVDCGFPLPKRGVDSGMYTLKIFIDSKNVIDELRENNNKVNQNSLGLN